MTKSDLRLCAFCRTPKTTYTRRHLSWFQIFVIVLFSLGVSGLVRNEIDQYFLFILFIQLTLGEIMVRMQYRGSVACRTCGFDPVIYKQDYKKARALVQATLAARENNPAMMLRRSLRLPKISASRLEQLSELEQKLEQLKRRENQGSNGVQADMPLTLANESKEMVGRLVSKEV